jgi:hypothetical protein
LLDFNSKPLKNNSKYIYSLVLLYFIISIVGILHHELWLDEAHHWLLSRDSETFLDLVKNTRYEGHPILWNILLYGITRFTLNPFWMQFLHILISTSVMFLFLRKAPFSLIFKTLFIFGYFMIFEYNLISRNYILGVLFLFLACSVFKDRDEKFILLSIYLALAANVHLMFCVITFALFLTLQLENFQNKQSFKKTYIIGTFIFGIGLLIAIIQILPPDDSLFLIRITKLPLSEKFVKGFISLFKGLITIPDFRTIHFWNSNLLVNLNKPFAAILGLLVYVIPLLLFFKNRKTLFFVYVALFGTQIFFFTTQLGATRYDGMTYLIIIIALWIENYYSDDTNKLSSFLYSKKLILLKKPIVYSILIIHFTSGVFAYTKDFKDSFTSSKETVDYLKKKKLNGLPIISVGCEATALSPYLEKKVWFLCSGSYQSYCRWNSACKFDVSKNNIIPLITNYLNTTDSAVFISNSFIIKNAKPNVWINANDKIKIRFLKKFDNDIVRNTQYYVFEVIKINAPK